MLNVADSTCIQPPKFHKAYKYAKTKSQRLYKKHIANISAYYCVYLFFPKIDIFNGHTAIANCNSSFDIYWVILNILIPAHYVKIHVCLYDFIVKSICL